MIYHVAPTDHEGDLLSLYAQFGDEAYDLYLERWPESGGLGLYHAHMVHCYATLDEAREHVNDGRIYAIDDADLDVEIDDLEFPHPVVRDAIPSAALTVIE